MKIFKKLSLLCCLLALFIAGCGKSATSVVGVWKVNSEASAATQSQAMTPAAKEMMTKAFANITLDFKSDNTYVLNMGLPMEGTWTQDGSGLVTLKTTKVMGQDISKMPSANSAASTFTCQLDSATNLLTFNAPATPGAATASSLKFEKQS